jgi:formylglycine-generating enzyme required for sulfatase activity
VTSKFALVIANTEYQDASFAKLTAPGKDAEEFAQVLRDAELAAFDDVQVLLNEGESKIRRSIARFFVNRQRDDLLLLYFSGHGVRNDQGQLFLAANDTEISILDATGIPADFVTHSMNNSRSQRQLLILDCCNSGAFAHGSKSASAIGKSMGIATAFEGSGFGRVVLTATDATQYAWEGDKVIGNTQKSVFTHFLIEGLKGDADRDGDGRIHVDELYDYAYEQVVRRTPKQTPGKWSYKQQGDLILRENLKPRDVKPVPLPADVLYYLEHPSSGVRSTGVEELIRLLDGKHLGLARAAQEKLLDIAENDDSLSLRKIASETLIAHGFAPEDVTPSPIKTPLLETKSVPPRKQGRQLFSLPCPGGQNTTRMLLVGGGVISILGIAVVIWMVTALINNPLVPRFTPQSPVTKAPTSPNPTLGVGSIGRGKDDMTLLYIPAGEFRMGSESRRSNERPLHTVNLHAYWIDKTEVTNAMYAKCEDVGVCNQPSQINSAIRNRYYGNAQFDNYPVIFVSWHDANDYCLWVGRRLPTEAEWEKAARGTSQAIYPWGSWINGDLVNYDGEIGDTTKVGTYPNGDSPYGVLDMAGNVWEWVADWYSDGYYQDTPSLNPQGPDVGTYKVLRGGSWTNGNFEVRSTYRFKADPSGVSFSIGFRCAASATP